MHFSQSLYCYVSGLSMPWGSFPYLMLKHAMDYILWGMVACYSPGSDWVSSQDIEVTWLRPARLRTTQNTKKFNMVLNVLVQFYFKKKNTRIGQKVFLFCLASPRHARQKYTQPWKMNLADLCMCQLFNLDHLETAKCFPKKYRARSDKPKL